MISRKHFIHLTRISFYLQISGSKPEGGILLLSRLTLEHIHLGRYINRGELLKVIYRERFFLGHFGSAIH